MPFGPLREVQRRFWVLVGEGVATEDAAVLIGVSFETGRRWFHQAGGVPPLSLVPPPQRGFRLGLAEREEIAAGVAAGLSIRCIAAQISRSPSTVMRELARHGRGGRYRRLARPGADPRGARTPTHYRASAAQARAEKWARRPKLAKLAGNGELRERVQTQLNDKLSPSRSRTGSRWTTPTRRRCGCRTRRSTSRCMCKAAGRCAAS